MTHFEAVKASVKALGTRAGSEHAALIALCEGLAVEVDAGGASAPLWREYRQAVLALEVLAQGEVADGQATLLELVRPTVRKPAKPRSKDAGAGAGKGRRNLGLSSDAVAAASSRRRTRASG